MSTCFQCNREFRSEGALEQHVRDSPAHEVIIFDCERCKRAFNSKEALQQHVEKSPMHFIGFNCSACGRAFKSEKALQQHLQAKSLHVVTPDSDNSSSGSGSVLQTQAQVSRPPKQGLTSSMHPSLHEDVLSLLETEGLVLDFHEAGGFNDCTHSYDTNIMGHFTCSTRSCPTVKWSSKKIALSIRLYDVGKYNAVVWHQRCRKCNALGSPTLGDSYAERVAYRIKKWHGIDMEIPQHAGKSKGPHQSNLCEGCKNGHCKDQEL